MTDASLLSIAIAVVIIGSLRLQKLGAMITPTCPEKNAPRHGVHEVSSSDGAAQLKRQTAEYIVVPQGVSLSSARPEMTRSECSRQFDKTSEEAITAKQQLSQKPKANQRQDGSSVQVQYSNTRQAARQDPPRCPRVLCLCGSALSERGTAVDCCSGSWLRLNFASYTQIPRDRVVIECVAW